MFGCLRSNSLFVFYGRLLLVGLVVLLVAIQLLTQLFLARGGVPLISVDGTKAKDECARGFLIAELSETQGGRNFSNTLEQSTYFSSHVQFFYFNDKRDHTYRYYESMQRRFLRTLAKHPNLSYEGPVYFILLDDATLHPHTAIAMQSACFPFMSHAYLSTAEFSNLHHHNSTLLPRTQTHHQNCSHLSVKSLFILQPDFHFIETWGFKTILAKIAKRAKKTNLESFE